MSVPRCGFRSHSGLHKQASKFPINIIILEIQPPYGGLLSNSCGGLQPSAAQEGPFGPKGEFAGQTNRRTKRQTDEGTDSQQTDGQTNRRTNGQKKRQTNGQMDGQTEGQTEGQTDG